jgi:ATP-dependent Zn protease
VLLIIGTIALVQFVSERRRNELDLSYNQFVQELARGNVVAVRITDLTRVHGELQNPATIRDQTSKSFSTIVPFEASDAWVAQLVEKGVEVRGGDAQQSFGVVVLTFLPYLLIFGLIIVMLRQMKGRHRQDGQ